MKIWYIYVYIFIPLKTLLFATLVSKWIICILGTCQDNLLALIKISSIHCLEKHPCSLIQSKTFLTTYIKVIIVHIYGGTPIFKDVTSE